MSNKIQIDFFILSALAVLAFIKLVAVLWAVIDVSKRKDLSSTEKHSITRVLVVFPFYGLYLYWSDFAKIREEKN